MDEPKVIIVSLPGSSSEPLHWFCASYRARLLINKFPWEVGSLLPVIRTCLSHSAAGSYRAAPAHKSHWPSRGAPNLSSGRGLTVCLLLQRVHADTSQEERPQLGSCQSQAIFSFISTQQGFNVLLLRVQS